MKNNLYIFPVDQSKEIDRIYNLYYRPTNNSSNKVDFLGLYNNKEIICVGKVISKVNILIRDKSIVFFKDNIEYDITKLKEINDNNILCDIFNFDENITNEYVFSNDTLSNLNIDNIHKIILDIIYRIEKTIKFVEDIDTEIENLTHNINTFYIIDNFELVDNYEFLTYGSPIKCDLLEFLNEKELSSLTSKKLSNLLTSKTIKIKSE